MLVEWQASNQSQTKVVVKPFAFACLFGQDVAGEKGVVEGQLSLFDDLVEEIREPATKIIRIDKVYQIGESLW